MMSEMERVAIVWYLKMCGHVCFWEGDTLVFPDMGYRFSVEEVKELIEFLFQMEGFGNEA
jgi:hypothetical protein